MSDSKEPNRFLYLSRGYSDQIGFPYQIFFIACIFGAGVLGGHFCFPADESKDSVKRELTMSQVCLSSLSAAANFVLDDCERHKVEIVQHMFPCFGLKN